MFAMPQPQIDELCGFAHTADKEARSDLAGSYIASENDYTSNLTGALRRIINSNSQTGLSATSFVLPAPDERLSGCDATIIITSNGYFKIATFEAKYPRISQANYSWDYAQTSTGLSHFSDQLDRQKRFARTHAIFEMFYCEIPFSQQPSYMQNEVSSCVWHEDAVAFDAKRPKPKDVWTSSDLTNLLRAGNHPIGIIIREICNCKRGAPSSIWGDVKAIARDSSVFGNVLHIAADGTDRTQDKDEDENNDGDEEGHDYKAIIIF
jgi:hypothetical protein